MENFVFENRTKIIFGRGTEERVGAETAAYSKKILLHYGGGSIKRSGLYDRVARALKKEGVEFEELSGVQPNPRLSLVREGIRLCREKGINMILAVGGGSAIDSAKAIAAGVPYNGDVWDFFCGKAAVREALPVATILTIPAAGSESSPSSVVTNEDGWYKRGLTTDYIRPVFSILNPELTFSLPAEQTAYGAADILAHIMERYFTNVRSADLTDHLCEAAMKTLIKNVPLALSEPDNYDIRAEIMWTGTVAHNDLLGTGRIGDWASHDIEHEVSAIYDIAHGAGLAIIFPAWMKFVYKHDVERFAQFAVRVFGVEMDHFNPERTALEGIRRLEDFFRHIGLPVRFSDLGIPADRFDEMALKCTSGGAGKVGNFVRLGRKDILDIYNLAES